MSFKIKDVITLFCNYLHDTLRTSLTPEHFRLAKYNKCCEDSVESFWETLDRLTHAILSPKNNDLLFGSLDQYTRVKIRFVFLKYERLEFYCLSSCNINTRELLFALVWITVSYNVLEHIVHLKLLNSSLGREFSKVDVDNNLETDCQLLTLDAQIKNLLHKSNQLSHNFKTIFELIIQKVKLLTKVHEASISAGGLPHLSVYEMNLIKTIATRKSEISDCKKEINEMKKTSAMLLTRMKWTETKKYFYAWMETVQDESEKDEQQLNEHILNEFLSFATILKQVIKSRLIDIKYDTQTDINPLTLQDCTCRNVRLKPSENNVQIYTEKLKNCLYHLNSSLANKKEGVINELESLIELVPNCFQI